MLIRYSVLSTSGSKAGELKHQDFDLAELVIGRGGKSNLIIQNRSMSLEHAVIGYENENDNYLTIKDLGSISGVRVNGSLVKLTQVKVNDVVSLGTFSFKVLKENDTWILLHEAQAVQDLSGDVDVLHKNLTLSNFIPLNTTISLVVVLVLLLLYLFRPLLFSSAKETYSVGKLTSHHAFIGSDCKACHTNAFNVASDKGCKECHDVSRHYDVDKYSSAEFSHIKFFHSNLSGEQNCVACHTEHKGFVTVTKDRLCTNCHAQIENVKKVENTFDLVNVVSWKKHPEFRTLQDTGSLKLNHAVHLKPGIRGDKGPENLSCQSCHVTDTAGKYMKKITYENNCQRCHTLEFDQRLPGKTVPHGNVDQVYQFLKGTYAQLALSSKESLTAGDTSRLQKPVTIASLKFEQEAVNNDIREAEKILYTKTGCMLCHAVGELDFDGKDLPDSSKFEIKDTNVLERWLSKSEFSHKKHQQMSCDGCHADVVKSEKSSDVLMPKIKDCQQCHASSDSLSACITCHNFHDQIKVPR